ncbi:MAG: hypothetical protein EOP49_13680 [Sphingobacteriales bacterium]|nr:MAG: hypothetical protein EOP49_13680 [Sphingobacteriales bacterium]
MDKAFKEQVYQHFHELVTGKIAPVQQKLDDLRDSLTGETKSTAGDKHETARAFVHIEQAQTAGQLTSLQQQKAELERVSGLAEQDRIAAGSLVETDRGYFYLSAGIGKAVIENVTVFALSTQSPLGKSLAGLTVGDTASVNGQSYLIKHIL